MPSLSGLQRRVTGLVSPAPMDDYAEYDEYWSRRGDIGIVLERWRIAARLIPDGAKVLDVGCGSGEFLAHLRSVKPTVAAKGVDLSHEAVERTRSRGFEAEVMSLDSASFGTYDVVTCLDVIEHVADAEAALGRLMNSASSAIVSVPNVGYIGCRTRLALFGRFPTTNCVHHIKEHLRHWTVKDFHEWVEHLGYRVTHVEGQYGFPFLWHRFPRLFASGVVYRIEK